MNADGPIPQRAAKSSANPDYQEALGLIASVKALHLRGQVHGCPSPERLVHSQSTGWSLMTPGSLALTSRVVPAFSGEALSHQSQESHQPQGLEIYAAPEELRGAAPSMRGDVYILGLGLAKLINGRHPHNSASAASALQSLAYTPCGAGADSKTADCAEAKGPAESAWAAVIHRALAERPWRRYRSAVALERDLGRRLQAPTKESRDAGEVGESEEKSAAAPAVRRRSLRLPKLPRLSESLLALDRHILPRLSAVRRWLQVRLWVEFQALRRQPHLLAGLCTLILAIVVGVATLRHLQRRDQERQRAASVAGNIRARRYDLAHATLNAWRLESPESALPLKLTGDLLCAESRSQLALPFYDEALKLDADLGDDASIASELLKSLDKHPTWRSPALVDALTRINDRYEPILERLTYDPRPEVRHRAVQILEGRSGTLHKAHIDYIAIYRLDLETAESCDAARIAVKHLRASKASAALNALREVERRLTHAGHNDCTLSVVRQAIAELEKGSN